MSEDAETAIRRLARERQALKDKKAWFDLRNVLGKTPDELALMAEERAMLEAELMRVDRDLRLAQGRYAERR